VNDTHTTNVLQVIKKEFKYFPKSFPLYRDSNSSESIVVVRRRKVGRIVWRWKTWLNLAHLERPLGKGDDYNPMSSHRNLKCILECCFETKKLVTWTFAKGSRSSASWLLGWGNSDPYVNPSLSQCSKYQAFKALMVTARQFWHSSPLEPLVVKKTEETPE
jgi:hypothetical protein